MARNSFASGNNRPTADGSPRLVRNISSSQYTDSSISSATMPSLATNSARERAREDAR